MDSLQFQALTDLITSASQWLGGLILALIVAVTWKG